MHEIDIRPPAASESNEVFSVHLAPFQVTRPPFQSVPAQNDTVGQDSELTPPPAGSTRRAEDHRLPLKTNTFPAQSPAAHSTAEDWDAGAHDTDCSDDPLESTRTDDQDDPSQTCARPEPSTATQNDADAHDTEVSPIPATRHEDQCEPFHAYALPSVSTATHQAEEAQDTEVSSSRMAAGPTGTGADHTVPLDVGPL